MGLDDDDDDDDEDDDDVDDVDEIEEVDDDVVVVVPPDSSPDPPQAVRDSARASPAAYEIGTRSVIFVTNQSLNSAF
jgi:hypothetical protein